MDGCGLDENEALHMVEVDDLVEVRSNSHRAVSSGEPSLDGSIDVDEERGALSDSDITHVARTQTLAAQVKGPSSDALEESCRLEAAERDRNSEWEDVLGSGQLLKKIIQAGVSDERAHDGQWVTIRAS
uniref:Uncharacterized protein n=1 Tax=Heterorhabditis bacteriophora TaxID=37862 RepID=A0A1I7XQ59_HETBA